MEASKQHLELGLVGQVAGGLDPGWRQEAEGDPSVGRQGMAPVREVLSPYHREGTLEELLRPIVKEDGLSRWADTLHAGELVLSPSPSKSNPSQLIKGVDEVGEVVDGPADEHQMKHQCLPWLIDPLRLQGGLDDEGLGGGGDLRQDLASARRRRLEDVMIGAAFL